VAHRLSWQVYDHELLELIAREMGLRTSLLESVDERRRSWLLDAAVNFDLSPQVSASSYVRHLCETLLSLSAHGECVIVGRGASLILPAETTLRVRLIAPREARIATTMRRLHLSQAEAARWVEQTDRDRTAFVKEHFQHDPSDLGNYDLIVDTAHWDVSECADLIVAGLQVVRQREQRARLEQS
jgi:cytidylate kinase